MKLRRVQPPFLHDGPTVGGMLGSTAFALCALFAVSAARYGMRPLVMAGLSVLTCLLCEAAAGLLRFGTPALTDGSAAVTGLVCAALVPLNAPLWLPCAAGAFGVLIAKEPFGGFGRNPFNPAAAGAAFVSVCWPKLMFTYFSPEQKYSLPAFGSCVFTAGTSPAAALREGLKPRELPFDLLWGEHAGPLGTGAALVIAAAALLLVATRSAHWQGTAGFLAAAALLAALFPRIACSALVSLKYEMLSGSLFFASVFLVSDPVTAPHSRTGRLLYGALAGALTMAFRRFGGYEQGACFAVLLANAVSPVIDDAVFRFRGWGGETE
jgi:electron transport complex protein RnfD